MGKGNERIEIEGELLHITEKAWLIREEMTGKEVWLARSVGTIVEPANDEGVILFDVPTWWAERAEIL